jgi:hypothetical protein
MMRAHGRSVDEFGVGHAIKYRDRVFHGSTLHALYVLQDQDCFTIILSESRRHSRRSALSISPT